MTDITRRAALTAGLAASAASCASTPKMTPFDALEPSGNMVFAHGVASGDPSADSIILWTRLSPQRLAADAPLAVVRWALAADPAFRDIRAAGRVATGPHRDWTVKVVADGLSPGQTYFYRFEHGGGRSETGRTRTLPIGATQAARFAVVSCSNYPFGYFNVYDQIARQDDLDAVIHLGDYIYEYGPDGYGGEVGAALGRPHAPSREVVTLDEYRERHAQYKSDPALQAMHGAHPLIAIWDDHETSNDSWKDGAQNHQPSSEGGWDARRAAALQAYYEWMPVRDPAVGAPREAIFRAYSYGDLLTLTAIESRLMARTRQFDYAEVTPTLKSQADIARFRDEILWDQSREMLGREQLDFVARALSDSVAAGQPWRLVANQIIMAKVTAPDLSPHVSEADIAALEKEWDQARAFVEFSKLGLPTNLDAWDGYPAARERLYDAVRAAGAQGLVVLTGDTHTWWANDLVAQDGAAIGVELGVNSVTSPSPYASSFLGGKGGDYALLTNRENKDVRYLSGDDHGFIDVTVTPDEVDARFKAVDTIASRAYNSFEKAGFKIKKRGDAVTFAGVSGLDLKERFLY